MLFVWKINGSVACGCAGRGRVYRKWSRVCWKLGHVIDLFYPGTFKGFLLRVSNNLENVEHVRLDDIEFTRTLATVSGLLSRNLPRTGNAPSYFCVTWSDSLSAYVRLTRSDKISDHVDTLRQCHLKMLWYRISLSWSSINFSPIRHLVGKKFWIISNWG